jgi:hypothetical protein
MKKVLFALATACTAAAISAPAQAGGAGSSSIGPAVLFGNGNSAIGAEGKFGVSDNLSIRPLIFFPNGGTIYGGSLTYDFDLSSRGSGNSKISPFVGGGLLVESFNNGGNSTSVGYFTGGADFAVSDAIDLKAAIDIPFSGNNSSTLFSVGAGFRF